MKSIAQKDREEFERMSKEFAEGFAESIKSLETIGFYIIDEEGNIHPERDIEKWAQWMVKTDKTVAFDCIGPADVSTVFLGLDHNLFGAGDPILFETMVSVPTDEGFDYAIDKATMRCSTKEQALEGHNNVVMFLKSLVDKGVLE